MGLEDDILRAVLGTPLDKEDQVDGILKEHEVEGDASDVLKGALRIIKAYEDVLPEDSFSILAKCAGYPAPATGQGQAQGEKKDDDRDRDDRPVYGYPIKKSADGEYDLSGVPEAFQPIVKELWIEKEERQKLTDQAITKELGEVVAKELSGLPVGPEFIPVLKGLRERAPDEYEKILPVMKAASKGLTQSALFRSHGRPGINSSAGAYDRIIAVAKSLVQKDATGLTLNEAICKVMEDPAYDSLIAEYEAEQESRTRAAGAGGE